MRQIEDGGYEDPDEEEGSVLGASREKNEADPAEDPASKEKAASVLGASRNAKTGDAGVTANAGAIAGAGGILAGWMATRKKNRKK
ncbi:MAG: hypothetical protein PUE63_02100 [Lachnospiraceae bacterium]|nr:hypothetical protein [Lachnospiraceae bacterium]